MSLTSLEHLNLLLLLSASYDRVLVTVVFKQGLHTRRDRTISLPLPPGSSVRTIGVCGTRFHFGPSLPRLYRLNLLASIRAGYFAGRLSTTSSYDDSPDSLTVLQMEHLCNSPRYYGRASTWTTATST